ncbi:hypothetical protein RJT34_17109 [Clitoria ternatea]|uniref:Growth-regulating factor n=1 Tax=Clitoria ternatea TaxID=43366 RepID=A0AAN9J8B9_CLITE
MFAFWFVFFGGVKGGPQKKIDLGHTMEGGDGVVVGDEEGKRVVSVKQKKDKSCSPVQLHLGVAASHYTLQQLQAINHVITEAQRRELRHQVFIFNHLPYNLSLPHHHLVQFPDTMSEYSHLGFGHGSMVDLEPHRCRRTDGKKWRCSKKIVPDQKYCESHMHRGRNRSRKHVETSQVNSPLVMKPSAHSNTKPASKTECETSNPNPLSVQHSDTTSSIPSRNLSVANCSSADRRSKKTLSSEDYLTSAVSCACGHTLAPAVAPKVVASVASDSRIFLKMCHKGNQTKSYNSNKISIKSGGGKGSIVGNINGISTGIGFSLRSVLQVSGCNPSYLNDRNNLEAEPGRCRRTDGKKWRCKSGVLPGQKYCATHMHRGAKKRFTNHEPEATTTTVVTIAQLPHSSATNNMQKASCTIPNTNLSMSVPASSPFIQCNEKSPSSSDTDTTITDTLKESSYSSF